LVNDKEMRTEYLLMGSQKTIDKAQIRSFESVMGDAEGLLKKK